MALPSLWRSGRERGELLPSRDIWEPFGSLRRDMERLFEDFSRDFGWGPPAAAGVGMAPRIDVSETDTELKIEAELPGVDEKDVEVVLERRAADHQGREEAGEGGEEEGLPHGRALLRIVRPFDRAAVRGGSRPRSEATFAKGVLTVTVPKPPEVKAKEKKITIGKG